jgi:hypothetical protein
MTWILFITAMIGSFILGVLISDANQKPVKKKRGKK